MSFVQLGGNNISGTYVHECNPGIKDPKPTNFVCEKNFTLDQWPTFVHLDRIQFTVEVENGGHVSITNFDGKPETDYVLHGLKTRYTFDVVFDYKEPTHCIEDRKSLCIKESLSIPDVTNISTFKVTWDGWYDTDSGIRKYEIEVFQLIPNGKVSDTTKLKYGEKVSVTFGPLNSSASEANMSVRNVGAYAVILITIDKAGNKKSSRRILIFDNISVVEKMNAPLRVTSASKETNYKWITSPCESIHVEWYNRFANKNHEGNGWLNSVEKVNEVDSILDDNEGERQISKKDNVHGIVRFEVGYETIYENNCSHIPFKSIPDLHSECADLNESIVDGKRLVIHLRAYDIMGKFAEDTANVTIDTSPPVIENLWLTRGDRVNISVSSVREFTNLTVEWLAYDFHSGIDYVRWRLYDNYTGHTIVHGLNHLSPQGETVSKEECQAKYMNCSRGPDCYCTLFNGCYHRHFSLRPHLSAVDGQGLRPENDKGVHEGDYFFEVEVKNTASLKTIVTIKVTIDTSPPHEGFVHEGFPDQSEVDFQQSRVIHAHWEGFFDKESGVLFYRYGFSNRCLPADFFVLSYKTNGVV
ncbi:hypothetical protein CHS0354_024496 [Potamilus streckersoni]|uniref:Ig-like domain-containing protein n=1 Tax=Potamilus streckersoni TaxID=2493646 RepID=A0AAE0WGC1_9BIVA|nr:hypothetical protein CHS0354_024496 [Potamilus streckersoni]